MCRSTRVQGNQNQGVGIDRVFWENVLNLVDIKRECSQGQAEAVASTQHMTSNNLCAFREDTRFNTRNVEHHTIPELTDVTPIPDATVNSGPDAEAFPQELMNYMEEVSSQRIPPVVYFEGSNCENHSAAVTQDGESDENSQNSLNHETKSEQVSEQGPLSGRYTEQKQSSQQTRQHCRSTGTKTSPM